MPPLPARDAAKAMPTARTGTRAHDANGVEPPPRSEGRSGPGSDGGPTPPSHALPSEAKAAKLASVASSVDPDQALRYAEASGDANPIHVDDAAAKAVGLPGVILHGMCTMALCGREVVDELAGGDPTRLRRLAVRFYRPVFPGNDLVTTMYDVGAEAGRQVIAFEASSAGKVVIRDGRADLGAPPPTVDGPQRLGA